MQSSSVGDVIEVETENGFTYLQVINLHASYPELIRHFEGVYSDSSSELDCIVARQSQMIGMAPVADMIKQGLIIGRKIGSAEVPAEYRAFPTFQMPVYDREGNVVYSWFWDGESIWYESEAKNDMESQKYLKREVISAKMLLERIAEENYLATRVGGTFLPRESF